MQKRIFNRNTSLEYRRELRNEATPQERILWSRLRNDQLGMRFRRQHSVGPYILDFFCPEKLIAVEIDGSQHLDVVEYDARRSAYLTSVGIRVLRFGNEEVNTNIEGVVAVVLSEMGEG